MGLRIPRFDANNLIDGKNRAVDIVVEGKESQIKMFREFIETNKPSNAKVSDITISDYDGDVMRITEYSQVLTAMQMLKAIPTLLEVCDNTREIQKNTNFIPQIARNTDLIPMIAENTNPIPLILEEVKGLKEDIQPGFAMQFRQMQVDIRAIRERLGMP
jgi:hypothetical protein